MDDELSSEERARVERALERDPSLRQELSSLVAVRQLLHRHGRVDAPMDFQARVLAAVAAEPKPRGSWWARWRRPLGVPIEAFAVAVAALLVVVVVGSRDREDVAPASGSFEAPPARTDQVTVAPERDPARAAPHTDSAVAATRDAQTRDAQLQQEPRVAQGIAGTGSTAASPRAGAPGDAGDAAGGPEPLAPVASPPALPSGTAEGRPAALFGASYRYRVRTEDPDAVARLLRLAGRFRGRVTDAEGQAVKDARGSGAVQSYRVQVPAENLAAFGAALRELGMVEEAPDDRIFASSSVTVQVDLLHSSGERPTRPRTTEADAPAVDAP